MPGLEELQRRAGERAAARVGDGEVLPGHVVCDGLVRIFQTEGVEVVALQGLGLVAEQGGIGGDRGRFRLRKVHTPSPGHRLTR